MRSRFAGAAIAAGVVLCGWAGTAEAAPFYFTAGLTGQDPFNYGGIFNAYIDTRINYGYFSLESLGYPSSGIGISETFYNITADITQYQAYNIVGQLVDTFAINASGSNSDGSSVSLNFTQDITNYNFDTSSVTICSSATQCYTSGFAGNGSFEIFPIPLPASAPLFGMAIMALGGLAYGRRRSAARA